MTSQYEPALNYEISFDPEEGRTCWIKRDVQYKFTNGSMTLKTKREKINESKPKDSSILTNR